MKKVIKISVHTSALQVNWVRLLKVSEMYPTFWNR